MNPFSGRRNWRAISWSGCPFLGASVAYRRKAHPGIDFLQRKMPDGLQKIASGTVYLASLTLYSWSCLFIGWQFAYFVTAPDITGPLSAQVDHIQYCPHSAALF